MDYAKLKKIYPLAWREFESFYPVVKTGQFVDDGNMILGTIEYPGDKNFNSPPEMEPDFLSIEMTKRFLDKISLMIIIDWDGLHFMPKILTRHLTLKVNDHFETRESSEEVAILYAFMILQDRLNSSPTKPF